MRACNPGALRDEPIGYQPDAPVGPFSRQRLHKDHR